AGVTAGAQAALFPLPFPRADLGVSLTDAPDPGQANQPVTYTATVSNSGPGATSSVLKLRFAAGTTVLTAPRTCSTKAGTTVEVTCAVPRLAAGQSVAVSVVVRYPSPGTRTVLAGVDAVIGTDPDRSDNLASATTVTDVEPADPARSRAYGPGLEGGVVGEKAPFSVELNRANGQRYQGTSAQVLVKATGPH